MRTIDSKRMIQAIFATRLLYVLGNCLVQCSILKRYRQIHAKRSFRNAVTFLIILTTLRSMASFLLLLLSCRPLSLLWDPVAQVEHPGRCLGIKTLQRFFFGMGIVK
jgi:hypothetical protein